MSPGASRNGRHHSSWATFTIAHERTSFRARGIRSMSHLVRDRWNYFQPDWRALGHLVAYVDWPRHLLDTGAHHDSDERRAGGHRLRVHDSDHHIWRGCDGPTSRPHTLA